MRLLFITNFYPPASQGGFEEWCQEVTDGLRSLGHDIVVLTSTHGREALQEPDPSWIQRELFLEMEFCSFRNAFLFFTSRQKRERENLARLRQIIKSYRPDAILIWGMWNLHRSLPALAENLMPGRVTYYMGDYWPTLPSQVESYWNSPARNVWVSLPKSLLKAIAKKILRREKKTHLCMDYVFFPSAFMSDEFERNGITPPSTRIVYGAIDTNLYLGYQKSWSHEDIISLLYVGRLTPEKGVHTAIKAMGYLVHEHGLEKLKLTIVGNGNPDYVDHLQELVKQEVVGAFVTFLPAQPKKTLPSLYHHADIFLFTSIWAEPFGRVIVEAMASGVAVIGSAVGGAGEILKNNENALTFTPDDHVDLGRKMKRLIESSSLRERLAKAGREIARNKFDICRMTTEIESCLQTLTH